MANMAKNTEMRLKKPGRRSKGISLLMLIIAFSLVVSIGSYLDLKNSEAEFKHKNMTFSTITATMLELLGIVIGISFGHLALIADERRFLDERYRGRVTRMIKACFSGINLGALVCLLLLTPLCSLLIYVQGGKSYFDKRYLLYIVGGIGVWPLMDFLQDNTQSEIILYNTLEKIEKTPAQVIAWNYYLNYVKTAALKFARACEYPCSQTSPELSSGKLLLLVSIGCNISDNLELVDNKIKKLSDKGTSTNPCFSIYRLKVEEHDEKYFAIQNVTEPLQTLRRMGALAVAKAVDKENLEAELQTFYFKLYEILTAPPDESSKGMLILVLIQEKNLHSLNNGGLVKHIIDAVKNSETIRNTTSHQYTDDKPKKQTRAISFEPEAVTTEEV